MLSPAPLSSGDRRPDAPLRAVLWDMDGTLVDTEPYWIAAEHELVESFGGTWSHAQAIQLVGQALDRSARILQAAGVRMPERQIISTLSTRVMERIEEAVPWRPGAQAMLDSLTANGVRCALVTMSERPLASLVVEKLPQKYFEFLVTGDDVTNGKPDPEAYLQAMATMQSTESALRVENFVALEDSVPGVGAALASGAVTIGIPHTVPLPEFPGRFTRWDTLAQKDFTAMQRILDGHWAGTPSGLDPEDGKVSA
ncbi:HAD family phosphatase [Arthrobacter sp. Y-9]|uniref:HAD family hydrolase n=1 Tax=Arthrobacter sp. Y-9 TaxID=3039385 RepID=UPI00241CFFB1|nr:HAD family phosphatase [Arthrobacter sp. Y-9]WFR82545.1 HAD family phosphatase [Arthrobacter sp. Y-9]